MKPYRATLSHLAAVLLLGSAVFFTGCTVTPKGENALRRAAVMAGKPFEKPYAQRHLPPLPLNARSRQLVRYALLNSPEVEKAYWQWRAAIEQIPQAGTQATTLMLNAGTTLQNGQASLANTILGAGNMTSSDIRWPSKLTTQARAALESARAAGWRYRAAIFAIRRAVLAAWYRYARTAALLRLNERRRQLLTTIAALSRAGISTGGRPARQWLVGRNAVDELDAQIIALQHQLPRDLAEVNAVLGRPAAAPMNPPPAVPALPLSRFGPKQLWLLAAHRNPQLRGLARDVSANRFDIRRAQQQYIPNFDLGLTSSLDGTAQSFSGALVIPVLRYKAINAAIAQARDQLRATQAAWRGTHVSLAAQLLVDIIAIHNDRRQIEIFHNAILPRLKIIAALARADFQQGNGGIDRQIQAQVEISAIRQTIVDLQADLDTRIADMDAIIAAPV